MRRCRSVNCASNWRRSACRGWRALPGRTASAPRLRAYEICRPLLEGRRGLEIGGPSAIFSRHWALAALSAVRPAGQLRLRERHGLARRSGRWRGVHIYDEDRAAGSESHPRCDLPGRNRGRVLRRGARLTHARAHRQPVAGPVRMETGRRGRRSPRPRPAAPGEHLRPPAPRDHPRRTSRRTSPPRPLQTTRRTSGSSSSCAT